MAAVRRSWAERHVGGDLAGVVDGIAYGFGFSLGRLELERRAGEGGGIFQEILRFQRGGKRYQSRV